MRYAVDTGEIELHRGSLRSRFHAAQGGGRREVCRVQGWTQGPHHPAGKGQGGHRRQDRYGHPPVNETDRTPWCAAPFPGDKPSVNLNFAARSVCGDTVATASPVQRVRSSISKHFPAPTKKKKKNVKIFQVL